MPATDTPTAQHGLTVQQIPRKRPTPSLRNGHGRPQALALVRLLGDRIENGPQHAEFSSSI